MKVNIVNPKEKFFSNDIGVRYHMVNAMIANKNG